MNPSGAACLVFEPIVLFILVIMSSESLVPLVHYTSYDEYEKLRDRLIQDYQEMIKEGLDIVKHKLWYHHGGSIGAQMHWLEEGINLWLKLTKGNGPKWCEQQSLHLLSQLNLVCETAAHVHSKLSKRSQSNQQIYDLILPLLRETIKEFIAPNVRPNHLELWEDANFGYSEERGSYPKNASAPVPQEIA